MCKTACEDCMTDEAIVNHGEVVLCRSIEREVRVLVWVVLRPAFSRDESRDCSPAPPIGGCRSHASHIKTSSMSDISSRDARVLTSLAFPPLLVYPKTASLYSTVVLYAMLLRTYLVFGRRETLKTVLSQPWTSEDLTHCSISDGTMVALIHMQ
jgi:hypothetical protein